MRICMENNGSKLIVYQNDIPAESLVDILLLLPVKSLCRFRCVSKLWRSLISDPSFIARHTNIAVEDKEVFLQRRRVLFDARLARNSFYEFSSIDLYEFLNKSKHDDNLTAAATQIEFDCQEMYPLVYSCNNLLFCKTQNGCYLVNPATREKKKILDLTSQTTRFALYGFGFDDSTGEYKVIAGEESIHRGIVFSVYSLKTDSWRHGKGPFPYLHESAEGVLLNGAVHWLVWTTRDSSLKIISMSITEEEEVQEIQLPLATYDRKLLGVFRDCLCVSSDSYSYSEEYVEFWVMKEYALYESWTKMKVRIPCKRLSRPGLSFSMPCNRLSHSHELIVFGRDLVMYDFRDDSFSFLSIRGVPEVGRSCAGIYVESLFSLASQESM